MCKTDVDLDLDPDCFGHSQEKVGEEGAGRATPNHRHPRAVVQLQMALLIELWREGVR
jgi:hypothetical protein